MNIEPQNIELRYFAVRYSFLKSGYASFFRVAGILFKNNDAAPENLLQFCWASMTFKFSLLVLPLMACFLLSFSFARKKPTRVVFFGDSITEIGAQPGGYITQMRDSLLHNGESSRFDLIGAGIGGNKVYDLYLRLENDVLAKKPKVVVLYVGVNDVWHKLTHHTGTDADKFRKFYLALIQKLQEKHIRVIACTPACIGERHTGANELDTELDAYAEIIRQAAAEKKVEVCDFRKAFTEYSAMHNPQNADKGVLTTDGVHLNQLGNSMVAEMLLSLLKK